MTHASHHAAHAPTRPRAYTPTHVLTPPSPALYTPRRRLSLSPCSLAEATFMECPSRPKDMGIEAATALRAVLAEVSSTARAAMA